MQDGIEWETHLHQSSSHSHAHACACACECACACACAVTLIFKLPSQGGSRNYILAYNRLQSAQNENIWGLRLNTNREKNIMRFWSVTKSNSTLLTFTMTSAGWTHNDHKWLYHMGHLLGPAFATFETNWGAIFHGIVTLDEPGSGRCGWLYYWP